MKKLLLKSIFYSLLEGISGANIFMSHARTQATQSILASHKFHIDY